MRTDQLGGSESEGVGEAGHCGGVDGPALTDSISGQIFHATLPLQRLAAAEPDTLRGACQRMHPGHRLMSRRLHDT
jgi:hypothetical protein